MEDVLEPRIPDDKPKGRGTLTVLAVIAAFIIAAALSAIIDQPSSPNPEDTQTDRTARTASVSSYLNEYGGDRSAYSRILDSSDCNDLQDQFDTAANNNDREEPGTPLFRATLGYMQAADDRLEAAGCYD